MNSIVVVSSHRMSDAMSGIGRQITGGKFSSSRLDGTALGTDLVQEIRRFLQLARQPEDISARAQWLINSNGHFRRSTGWLADLSRGGKGILVAC
jgi:hypothetical protein